VNYIDLGILILVASCALFGYQQGLIRTVYRLASFFISLILARILYPHVAKILSGTVLYDIIQESVKSGLNLENFVAEYATGMQTEIIDALPLPAQLRGLLHAQFSPDVHGILQVETIEDYISAFFANIAINGIAIVAVFLLIIIILSVVGAVLDVVGKLPVIKTFNNYGGLIFGIIMGAGISWIAIIAMSLLFTTANPEFYEILQNSFIARRVLDSMIPHLVSVGR
jgi:uncharacterized membrane protein required for colicin V production